MRIISTLIFLVTITTTFGQYIDGPANIRNKPNGDKLFSINNLGSIQLDEELQNDWNKIYLHCFVKPNQLIKRKTIKANSVLLNSKGDSIGYTLTEFQVNENFDENYRDYNKLEFIYIELSGFMYKDNIKHNITFEEILNNKPSYLDSCQNTYITYQEENGKYITLIHKCNMYETSILINNDYVPIFVKEFQDIKRISCVEGQESTIKLEMKSDYFSETIKTKIFTVEADEIEINDKLIKAVKYGCCGAEDYYQAFNSLTHNKLMDYESKLYIIDIPNSPIEGYLGFFVAGYEPKEEKMIIGTLTFTDGDNIINKVNFVTQDKQKYDNIFRFVPDMEFIALNTKDNVNQNKDRIELWTKNFSKSPKDLTDFQFIIKFYDKSNSKTYIQKLDFINGYINGNNKSEFDIMIDK
ncbi:MAG TPA: hypothetical protein PLF32_06215 [Bacteroidales bacterium]|nr:hypothetical protein [Bacteroidales bacterium]HOR82232.1 hypothetical protein [Bacteroidales bacterium]HPJ91556.1 hypothetical protein [Bacteroidales bacterium]